MSNGEVQVQLISPATTPGSIRGEDRCLTEPFKKNPGQAYKQKWKLSGWQLIPCFMATVSIVQVLIHLSCDEATTRLLRFEPSLRWQCWRFFTYMLVHFGRIHLVLNVVIQCLLSITLEVEQGGGRTVAVYVGGGVFGALGACILQPQPMVGASAGIYALLISHLAHLYLNFNSLKYKIYRIFAVCVLAGSDIIFCFFHTKSAGHPSISLSAHGSGGLAGLLLGLVIYKISDFPKNGHRKFVFWGALVITLLLLIVAIVLVVTLSGEFFRR